MSKLRIWFNLLWGLPLAIGCALAIWAPWWWLRLIAAIHLVLLGELRILLNRESWSSIAEDMQEQHHE